MIRRIPWSLPVIVLFALPSTCLGQDFFSWIGPNLELFRRAENWQNVGNGVSQPPPGPLDAALFRRTGDYIVNFDLASHNTQSFFVNNGNPTFRPVGLDQFVLREYSVASNAEIATNDRDPAALTVTGNADRRFQLNIGGVLNMGDVVSGSTGGLNVAERAQVVARDVRATRGEINVDGPNAGLQAQRFFDLGLVNQGSASLSIVNGGAVAGGIANVGGVGSRVTVDGAGSTWTPESVRVRGGSADVFVRNGGSIDVAQQFELSNGTLTLDNGTFRANQLVNSQLVDAIGPAVIDAPIRNQGTLSGPGGSDFLELRGDVDGNGSYDGNFRILAGLTLGDDSSAFGNLALEPTSTFRLEEAANSLQTFDGINVSGDLSLGGTLQLLANQTNRLTARDFTLFQVDGMLTGQFLGLDEGAVFAAVNDPSLRYSISYLGGDGNDVVLTAVPEPTTCVIVLIALIISTIGGRSRVSFVP